MNITTSVSKALVHAKSAVDAIRAAKASGEGPAIGILLPGSLAQRHASVGALWARAYAIAVRSRGMRAHLIASPDDLGETSAVLWRPNQNMVAPRIRFSKAASDQFVSLAASIERSRPIAPSSHEVSFLENKIHMHAEFDRTGVRAPRTIVAHDERELLAACDEIGLPAIIKGPFSYYSLHVHRLTTRDELDTLRRHLAAPTPGEYERTLRYPVLVQQFIDLRRDMRLIVVANKIVLSYWRVNSKKEWVSTATRFGSKVYFEQIPERWHDYVIAMFGRLGMRWAAIDIAWDHDDLETEPYVLEVSPCFDPNPAPPPRFHDDYYSYKFDTRLRDNWHLDYWNAIKMVAGRQVDLVLGTSAH